MRKYVRDKLEDTYGILDYQEELLKIMVDIDSFCKAHGIDYCLMAGSALGAERHQLKVPANNKEYLKIQFGEDYMTLPPLEKRPINKHAKKNTGNCFF